MSDTPKKTLSLKAKGNEEANNARIEERLHKVLAQAGLGSRRALELRGSRANAAEAHTILAECAQMAGQPRAAVERYLLVARRYSNLPAGETALFAAARIEANAGHLQAARDLFERYLERYPDGTLRAEAERRLRAISTPDP